MKIETKFDPEDEVFAIFKDEIVKVKIEVIEAKVTFEKVVLNYKVRLKGRKTLLNADENELHKTVEDVIESLKSKFENE